MNQMSAYMQVFSITHLPQIAAKGQSHFKVFKQDTQNTTVTSLKKLNNTRACRRNCANARGQRIIRIGNRTCKSVIELMLYLPQKLNKNRHLNI